MKDECQDRKKHELHEVVDNGEMVKQERIGEEEATDSLSLLQ